jgi:DNA-binding response OmpR family regulator
MVIKNRILVIDDDQFYLEQIKMILTENGFDVKAAANAEQGLALLGSFHPDIMLLDWELPNISGIEVLATIRKKKMDINLYVIMLSGRIMTENIVEAFNAGANDYVIKPFSSDELFARIYNGIRICRSGKQIVLDKTKMLEAVRKFDTLCSHLPSSVSTEKQTALMLSDLKELLVTMKNDLQIDADVRA